MINIKRIVAKAFKNKRSKEIYIIITFMIRFKDEPLFVVLEYLKKELLALHAKDILEVIAQTNDIKKWVEIAQIFHCKLLMPKQLDETNILLQFQKLDSSHSFHSVNNDIEEKYGMDSQFSLIQKNDEPTFLYYFLQALENASIEKRIRILNLGINSGEEFEAIKNLVKDFNSLELIGIDYCQSAINKANEKFQNDSNVKCICHDINELQSLELGKFDLIISIGTLQSSSLEFKPLFMNIVKDYLKKDGAMILGFPNCRWIDNTMIYGAKAPNYKFSEMSILFNDAIFCKKYLQQKKFRVTLTGKDYIFLTATSINKMN